MSRGMGRAPGGTGGRASAYERYYTAKAEEQETKNRVRAGQLLEATEAEARWGGLLAEIREAFLNLTAVCVQRGVVARAKEAEHQGLVDGILARLQARAPTRRRRR